MRFRKLAACLAFILAVTAIAGNDTARAFVGDTEGLENAFTGETVDAATFDTTFTEEQDRFDDLTVYYHIEPSDDIDDYVESLSLEKDEENGKMKANATFLQPGYYLLYLIRGVYSARVLATWTWEVKEGNAASFQYSTTEISDCFDRGGIYTLSVQYITDEEKATLLEQDDEDDYEDDWEESWMNNDFDRWYRTATDLRNSSCHGGICPVVGYSPENGGFPMLTGLNWDPDSMTLSWADPSEDFKQYVESCWVCMCSDQGHDIDDKFVRFSTQNSVTFSEPAAGDVGYGTDTWLAPSFEFEIHSSNIFKYRHTFYSWPENPADYIFLRINTGYGNVYVWNRQVDKGIFTLEIEKKNGAAWETTETDMGTGKYSLNQSGGGDDESWTKVQEHFKDSGTYRAKVTVTYNGEITGTYYSGEFDYTKPAATMASPTNVKWVTEDGSTYMTWDAVANASYGYSAYLFKDGVNTGYSWSVSINKSRLSDNLFQRLGNGSYTYKVVALSPDISQQSFSQYATSDVYNYEGGSQDDDIYVDPPQNWSASPDANDYFGEVRLVANKNDGTVTAEFEYKKKTYYEVRVYRGWNEHISNYYLSPDEEEENGGLFKQNISAEFGNKGAYWIAVLASDDEEDFDWNSTDMFYDDSITHSAPSKAIQYAPKAALTRLTDLKWDADTHTLSWKNPVGDTAQYYNGAEISIYANGDYGTDRNVTSDQTSVVFNDVTSEDEDENEIPWTDEMYENATFFVNMYSSDIFNARNVWFSFPEKDTDMVYSEILQGYVYVENRQEEGTFTVWLERKNGDKWDKLTKERVWNLSGNDGNTSNFHAHSYIDASGTYRPVVVVTHPDGSTREYLGKEWVYVKPDEAYPAPTNLKWETAENGDIVLSWDPVEGTTVVFVDLYKDGELEQKDIWHNGDAKWYLYSKSGNWNYLRYGYGDYFVKIKAISNDMTVKYNSDYATSEVYKYEKPAGVKVTGVTLDKKTLSIAEGETAALTAVIAPENAADKSVTWTSAEETIATVTGGTVKGVAAGKTTITATTVDGGKTDTAEVTVRHAIPKAAYANSKLTGLAAGAAYLINGKTSVTADTDGCVTVDSSWYNTTVTIVRVNADVALNSEAQSLTIPAAAEITPQPEPEKDEPVVPEKADKTEILEPVTRKFAGEEVTVDLSMSHKSAVLYTGQVITAKQLDINVDTSSLENVINEKIAGNKKGVKAEDIFTVKYVGNKKKAVGSEAEMYGKLVYNEKKAKKAGLNKTERKELKKLISELNAELKNNAAKFEIKPIDLSDPANTVIVKAKFNKKGKIKIKNGKIKDVRSVKVKLSNTKTITIPAKQYSIEVVDVGNNLVKVTGKGNFTGTSPEVTVIK